MRTARYTHPKDDTIGFAARPWTVRDGIIRANLVEIHGHNCVTILAVASVGAPGGHDVASGYSDGVILYVLVRANGEQGESLQAFVLRVPLRMLPLLLAFIIVTLGARSANASNNFPGTTISGNSGSLLASNVGATSQTGEPTTYGGGAVNSMWYSWTAPANGTLTVETCSNTQTNFDTTLKTYTGTAVNALTTVAQNDDACATTFNSSYASRNTVAVTAGTTYRIQVDGYSSATGSFLLSWDFAANTPQFAVTKSASVSSISSPGTITYTITVENTGNTTLTGLTISDSLTLGGSSRTLTSGPTYVSGDTNSNGQINTTETWTYTATYAVTQADIDQGGTFSNTVTYDTAQTAPSTSAAATTTITQTPAMSLTKSAILLTDLNNDGEAGVGDVVRYTYAATNTGNVTISNVTVSETAFNGSNGTPVPGSETLTGDVAPTGDSTDLAGPGIWGTLRPNDTVSFTADYTVNQQDVDQLQ